MAGESGENALWIGQKKHLFGFIQEGSWREGLAVSFWPIKKHRGRALSREVDPTAVGESPRVRLPSREWRGRGLPTRAEWAGPWALGGANVVSRGAGCGRRRGSRGPGDGRSPSRLCWWPPPLPEPERPRLFPRVAASQGGGMLGKGVVGGGGGTKAPKPSFVSYVRPEVRGRRAGGASGWSGRGEGCSDPLPRCGERGRRFLPVCWRGTGPGEARRGAPGPPRGRSGDPRRGQAGAQAQGPACRRPGEGARAGKVLRPGTSLGTLEELGFGAPREEKGWVVQTPVGPAGSPPPGWVYPGNFSVSLPSLLISTASC